MLACFRLDGRRFRRRRFIGEFAAITPQRRQQLGNHLFQNDGVIGKFAESKTADAFVADGETVVKKKD